MQKDRNLVVYGTPRNPIWHTRTNNNCGVGPARLVMQNDGNIVIYDATNKPIWDAHTMGKVVLLEVFSYMGAGCICAQLCLWAPPRLRSVRSIDAYVV